MLAYLLHAGLVDLISTVDTDSIVLTAMLGDDTKDGGLLFDLDIMTGTCQYLSCHDIANPTSDLFKDDGLKEAWIDFHYAGSSNSCDCQCLTKKCDTLCHRCGIRHLTEWIHIEPSEENKKTQHLRTLPVDTRSRKRQRETNAPSPIQQISSLFYFLVGYGCLTGTDYGKIDGKGPAKINLINTLTNDPKFVALTRCYKFGLIMDFNLNMCTLMKATNEEDKEHVKNLTSAVIPFSDCSRRLFGGMARREKLYRIGSKADIAETLTMDMLPFSQIANPETATNEQLKYFISCRNSYTFEATKMANLQFVKNIQEIEKLGPAQLIDPDGKSVLFYLQNLKIVCQAASK